MCNAKYNGIRETTFVEDVKVMNVFCSQKMKHFVLACRTYGITCVSNLRRNIITTLLRSVFNDEQ